MCYIFLIYNNLASRPNDYHLIYCENGSIHHNGPLNVRSPFTRNVYPVQSLVPPDFLKKNLTLADKNQEGAHQTYYHETIPVHTTKNNSIFFASNKLKA